MGRDIALICGDGAIRGGFIAGALTRLLESYPAEMTDVHTITASSASVGSMFYFISHGQKHPGRSIWTSELASPKFIDYHGLIDFFKDKPVYDIEYMTETVFREHNPINKDKILLSSTNFFFPVYNIDNNCIEIFSNREPDKITHNHFSQTYKFRYIGDHDIYKLIAAANAAPFVYDRPVKIGDFRYIDAAAWKPFLLDVPGINSTKKLVIVTKFDNSLRRTINYRMMGYVFPLLFLPFRRQRLPLDAYWQYGRKPRVNNHLANTSKILRAYDELALISPPERLGSQTDNSESTLNRNFELGYNVVDRMRDELVRFFSL